MKKIKDSTRKWTDMWTLNLLNKYKNIYESQIFVLIKIFFYIFKSNLNVVIIKN